MAGIVFLKTQKLERILDFYTSMIEATVWVDQKDCIIFKHDNFLFGFCEGVKTEKVGLLTFFYQTIEEVDRMYDKLRNIAITQPKRNEKYRIYQFFATDPEGRDLEFQSFLHEIDFGWSFYS
ncbi:MAG: VOC family protein [Candidatus Heimdallarchaeota archaeon]